MKLVLLVEGHSEKQGVGPFLKRWLDKRLTRPIGIQPMRFHGWGDLLRELPEHAQRILHGPKSQKIAAVVALLDLYGPTYPSSVTSATRRYEWLKTTYEQSVGDERFRLFAAVHEIEAWLLAQPDVFPPAIQKSLPRKKPESINFDTPPSKLLNQIYQKQTRRRYKKLADGTQLFAKLDPDRVYERCPRFAAMMDEILALLRER
ncbi:MAG: DUF4276 family protein [Acidobacteriota bacterium]